jgi:hypothetical protein
VEYLLAIASTVSALAAVGAVWFAYRTVVETRALRREDRLARLTELVAEAGMGALELVSATGRSSWTYPITTKRLAAHLALLDDALPACRKLASGQAFEGVGVGSPGGYVPLRVCPAQVS